MATAKASNPQGWHMLAEAPPARVAACCQQGQHPPVANSQRGDARGGASRGSGVGRRGGCPLARRLSASKGSRCLRRGGGDSVVRVREEC
ncbi:hypothetical protein B296_00000584 [Ensete ventricosum]|uniref:Uncharacterized protein n=1 Tax=Ensete ventricosum TaxID=4639 RepID=A0A426ZS44_ENSVE|nr:hypothetical protein B296_00000584 [Ensete ventricosum]